MPRVLTENGKVDGTVVTSPSFCIGANYADNYGQPDGDTTFTRTYNYLNGTTLTARTSKTVDVTTYTFSQWEINGSPGTMMMLGLDRMVLRKRKVEGVEKKYLRLLCRFTPGNDGEKRIPARLPPEAYWGTHAGMTEPV